jgi:hypothetical protein
MESSCSHRRQIVVRDLPSQTDGCEDCLATGGRWPHLRMCMTCGKVGCCSVHSDVDQAPPTQGHSQSDLTELRL